MIRQQLLLSQPFRNVVGLSFQRAACRFYCSTKLKQQRPKKDETEQSYGDLSFLKKDMPPLMDFLRDLHQNRVKEIRDVVPNHPPPSEIANEYDYHDSSLSDDLRTQAKVFSTIDKEDIDVKRLRESELDKYQMMSQNDLRRRDRFATSSFGSKSLSFTTTTTPTHSSTGSGSTCSATAIVNSSGDYHSDVGEDSDDDRCENDEWCGEVDTDDNVESTQVLSPQVLPASIDVSPICISTSEMTSSSSWSVSLNDEHDFVEEGFEKASEKSDLNDSFNSALDEKFRTEPEGLEKGEKELSEATDEKDGGLTNLNRYHQPWNEELAPRKLENWWDRDADLVDKAKRKMKLDSLRKAQENPLLKKCRTCPICKREWKGHKSMVAHVLNKGACYNQLDETLKEQLTARNIELKTKKKKKKAHKYPFEI